MFSKFRKSVLTVLILFLSMGLSNAANDLPASFPTVVNVTLTSANTEYTYNIPNDISTITVKSRTAADFKMATTSGQSGTTYFTVPSGLAYYETQIASFNSHQLYFQSANAGQIIEIIYW